MGIVAIDAAQVAVRYAPCPGERIEWIELTEAENGRGTRLWRADTEATTAASAAEGLAIPVALDPDRTYEIAVRTDRGEGGQEIEDGPPIAGEVLVRDERVTIDEFTRAAARTCDD
jgi:hypothetical protein